MSIVGDSVIRNRAKAPYFSNATSEVIHADNILNAEQ